MSHREKGADKYEQKHEENLAVSDNDHEHVDVNTVPVTLDGEFSDDERPEVVSEPTPNEPDDWHTAASSLVTKKKKKHPNAFMWE